MVKSSDDAEGEGQEARAERAPHDHLYKVTGLSSSDLEKLGREPEPEPADFETAIAATGYGKFNILLMFAAFPGFWSAVSVTSSVSYIFTRAKCDMQLSLLDMGTITAITYGGMISSALLWGFLSDTLGRRRIMVWGFFGTGLVELAAAVSQNFPMLIITRFLAGFLFNGPYAVLLSYIAELHRTELRARVILYTSLFYTIANSTLPLLAWAVLTKDWHLKIYGNFVDDEKENEKVLNFFITHLFQVIRAWNVFLVVTALMPLLSGLAFTILPESPKFLMSRGRNEEAMAVFHKIYTSNTGNTPDKFPSEQLARGAAALRGGARQLAPLVHAPHGFWLLLMCLIHIGLMFGSVQKQNSKLLLLGDFNAHIGRDDNRGTKTRSRLQSISPTSNHLGSFLLDFCEQHNLVISSTWGRRSCKQGQNPLDWNQLNEILRSSVRTLEVQQNKSKTSRLALAKFMKAKFWKNRSPKDPATIQNFKDARKELLDLQEKEDEEKCQHFFAQMHKNGWKQFKFNPKKARPQSVNDYRKISICNAGYRIYATYLLKLLDEEIETMGNYQAAFMRYRSTDDHIFVVRRILDENGRQNHVLSQRTYVNPMVWTKPKVSPKEKGQTRMSTLTSAFYHCVGRRLRTLEELVSEVRLDQDAEINLPVILSFADDIIIIDKDASQRSNQQEHSQTNTGNKWSPNHPVDTIKYLGTYLTSELSRRDTIKARCKQAIRNAKGLIPFIKKTKMHWKIAKSNTLRLWFPQLAAMIGAQEGSDLCAAIAPTTVDPIIPEEVETCKPIETNMMTYLQSVVVGAGSVLTYGIGGLLVNSCGKRLVAGVCTVTCAAVVMLLPLFGNGSFAVVGMVTTALALTSLASASLSSIMVDLFPTAISGGARPKLNVGKVYFSRPSDGA
ncbi:Synaptic vesicle glycoprotein 2C [Eumeta japonica]|uniref:Synaptic vesicle glycoprotein 2C n=1 Tax=Eumeta variegata TaxID=151549 RepID=A0A4C1X7R2_EUMVA|nr:Synaptic vesicle glycoprotein 2C [Eumeta japonica]